MTFFADIINLGDVGMVIYVDVLIFLNTVVNYLLINLTSFVLKKKVKVSKEVIASFVGALFSLYIFIPTQSFVIEMIMRVLPVTLITLICYGYKSFKAFLREIVLFYAISFIYAGMMMGAYMLFKPQRLSINNGIVYFDISPLVLITASLIFYIFFCFLKKLSERKSQYADRCEIIIINQDVEINTTAMLDSGHSLKDLYGDSLVFIINRKTSEKLFGVQETKALLELEPPKEQKQKECYRLLPVNTVSGQALMPGIKVSKLKVYIKDNTIDFDQPIAVVSGDSLGDDFSVILPLDAINEG